LLVLYYSNFIGVKWEKEALVPRVDEPVLVRRQAVGTTKEIKP
jgi:hypothetical protein